MISRACGNPGVTCGNDFTLYSHQMVNTGEKPYDCGACGRNFAEVIVLKRHLRTHTGEKLYKYETCGKVFMHYSQLKYHKTKPSRVAQSITCLATDASLTASPGVASSIPAQPHTFVEIDHEIISTVILFPSDE